jgi:hypothetical protein
MGYIEVDPASLKQVAHHLTEGASVAHEVQKHHARLASHASQAGHPAVTLAAASFLDRWSYGCGCLITDAEATASALQKAGVLYLHTDETVTRAERREH